MALKNRHLVFAKNCTNAHGTFAKGDTARGAFSDQLIADYLDVGILVEREATNTAITPETGNDHEAAAEQGSSITPAAAKPAKKR